MLSQATVAGGGGVGWGGGGIITPALISHISCCEKQIWWFIPKYFSELWCLVNTEGIILSMKGQISSPGIWDIRNHLSIGRIWFTVQLLSM